MQSEIFKKAAAGKTAAASYHVEQPSQTNRVDGDTSVTVKAVHLNRVQLYQFFISALFLKTLGPNHLASVRIRLPNRDDGETGSDCESLPWYRR